MALKPRAFTGLPCIPSPGGSWLATGVKWPPKGTVVSQLGDPTIQGQDIM